MPHPARNIIERELSQLNWSHAWSREALMEHFRMAPTVRQVLADHLPDRTFHSAKEVAEAIPSQAWQHIEHIYESGADSNFLKSRAANFQDHGESPG
mgnify:FL=1